MKRLAPVALVLGVLFALALVGPATAWSPTTPTEKYTQFQKWHIVSWWGHYSALWEAADLANPDAITPLIVSINKELVWFEKHKPAKCYAQAWTEERLFLRYARLEWTYLRDYLRIGTEAGAEWMRDASHWYDARAFAAHARADRLIVSGLCR